MSALHPIFAKQAVAGGDGAATRSAGCTLLTAIRRVAAGSRPAAVVAAAIRAVTAANCRRFRVPHRSFGPPPGYRALAYLVRGRDSSGRGGERRGAGMAKAGQVAPAGPNVAKGFAL